MVSSDDNQNTTTGLSVRNNGNTAKSPIADFNTMMRSKYENCGDNNAEEYDFKLGYLRLFKAELTNLLSNQEHFAMFKDFLRNEKELNFVLSATEEDLEMKRKVIWRRICFDPNGMEKLISFAEECDPRLVETIYESIDNESLNYYLKLFGYPSTERQHGDDKKLIIDVLVDTFEPLPICKCLSQDEYADLVKRVRELINLKHFEEASCYFLRSIPRIRGERNYTCEWYYDFLSACLLDPANCTIPEFIDTEFEIHLEIFNKKRFGCMLDDESNFQTKNEAPLPLMISKEDAQSVDRICRSQRDYQKFRPVCSDANCNIEPIPIVLRPYQEELVEEACKRVNTIICAPTGSGKTIVAAYAINQHLSNAQLENRAARVAMIVPTVPLVDQQARILDRYLGSMYCILKASGIERFGINTRSSSILASDIIVFTPQVLVNSLQNVRFDERLYLSDFTLFIFDECHHCCGNHPYNVLMHMWHESELNKPQVIGLSASLPIANTRINVDVAFGCLLDLCAYMAANAVSTVRKTIQNLEEFVQPPIDEILSVSASESDLFTKAIKTCSSEIETMLKEALHEQHALNLQHKPIRFPGSRALVQYGSYVSMLKSSLMCLPGSQAKHDIVLMLDDLMCYCRAFYFCHQLPNRYAYEYLKNQLHIIVAPNEEDHMLNKLQNLFKENVQSIMEGEISWTSNDHDHENKDILVTLQRILREQFKKMPLSRVLIFVTTRYVCTRLAEYLNLLKISSNDGITAAVGFVISCNQTIGYSKQAANEQRSMLENFNSGALKILVATSVAEEGLDISSCNLVIKYNCASSQTALIQRRGRARAKDSRSILLALDGAVEEREIISIKKQYLMNACIMHMQTLSKMQMKNLIERKWNEISAINKALQWEENERKLLFVSKRFDILCRFCGAYISESPFIRVACNSIYICCDPKIWDRLHLVAQSKSKDLLLALEVGNIFCKGSSELPCRGRLGSVIKLFGAFLPTLSVKHVQFRDRYDANSSVSFLKKWEEAARKTFCIKPITETELKEMLQSFMLHSPKTCEELEFESHRALQLLYKESRRQIGDDVHNIFDF